MADTFTNAQARERICELCRLFWQLGWASGTGGGISLRVGDTIFMAPSGVEKERLQPSDIFELDRRGQVVKPSPGHKLTACAPLFAVDDPDATVLGYTATEDAPPFFEAASKHANPSRCTCAVGELTPSNGKRKSAPSKLCASRKPPATA